MRTIAAYQDSTLASNQSGQGAFLGVLCAVISFAFSSAVLCLSILRETAAFWRTAGGYSVELREFVRESFYLSATGSLIMLIIAIITVMDSRCSWRTCVLQLWTVFLSGTLLVVSGGIVVSNNLVNLWEGRALHYHP